MQGSLSERSTISVAYISVNICVESPGGVSVYLVLGTFARLVVVVTMSAYVCLIAYVDFHMSVRIYKDVTPLEFGDGQLAHTLEIFIILQHSVESAAGNRVSA